VSPRKYPASLFAPGDRHGRLIIEELGPVVHGHPTMLCRCDCGALTRPTCRQLALHLARSCGAAGCREHHKRNARRPSLYFHLFSLALRQGLLAHGGSGSHLPRGRRPDTATLRALLPGEALEWEARHRGARAATG
jgi:hypothetical protein